MPESIIRLRKHESVVTNDRWIICSCCCANAISKLRESLDQFPFLVDQSAPLLRQGRKPSFQVGAIDCVRVDAY